MLLYTAIKHWIGSRLKFQLMQGTSVSETEHSFPPPPTPGTAP